MLRQGGLVEQSCKQVGVVRHCLEVEGIIDSSVSGLRKAKDAVLLDLLALNNGRVASEGSSIRRPCGTITRASTDSLSYSTPCSTLTRRHLRSLSRILATRNWAAALTSLLRILVDRPSLPLSPTRSSLFVASDSPPRLGSTKRYDFGPLDHGSPPQTPVLPISHIRPVLITQPIQHSFLR